MNETIALRILRAKGEEFDFFNREADNLAKNLAQEKLSYTQLRKVFEMIRKIEYEQEKEGLDSLSENCLKSLLLLKPKLLYMAERQPSLKRLQEAMTVLIDELIRSKSVEQFQNFVAFLEAVVAYHYHYEQENKRNKRRRR